MELKFLRTFFESDPKKSTLGIKYPTYRDHPLHTSHVWLEGKKIDDGAEGLWRIHDKLYDVSEFISRHPGGSSWLKMTKGTDITEAFEVHHISTNAYVILERYFVRAAKTDRIFPFTFHENDFYQVLKRRVREALKNIPENVADRSKIFADFLLVFYLVFALSSAYYKSFTLATVAGFSLSLLAVIAHNFFHQRDNFRMYYFDLSFLSSSEWRISHAISHHLYTNSIHDLEISALEPWLQYLPQKKPIFFRYFPLIYFPIFYVFIFIGSYIKSIIQGVSNKEFSPTLLLPLIVPSVMIMIGSNPLIILWMIITASIHFGFVGLNAGHHLPVNFHDGDAIRPKNEMDWGIYQLDSVLDRTEITGSHFLVLTHFGDHALHHLFPTLDHGKLQFLYPILEETCKEFGTEFRMTSQLNTIRGQFQQLTTVTPRKNPPKALVRVKK